MNLFKNFPSIAIALLLVVPAQAANLRQTQEHIDRVIKDVIVSSIHADGEINAAQMDSAKAVGFKEQEVEYVVAIAQDKGDFHEIANFLDSVYILPVEATQWAMHHVEIIPKDTSKIQKNPAVRDPRKYEVDGPFATKLKAHEDVDDERLSAIKPRIATPDALANAIESAVNSEDGSISRQALQVAMASGWSEDEVLHVARMALESVEDNGGDKTEVLSEIQKLRGPQKEEKPKKQFEPLPTHTWT
eukprot:CAMPEP_0194209408 /NCGR_PEP_ID=MMETSP0156-20130528/7544_1 /TAXON_ID=33649 /ORGANISM="Thalassionema nitzschioides, Strain L26-B" /LENGTH=245 /DNA_ID=CAMNT_0038936575 /DNA_START=52 /DNA_END=789 /DNA_ORIENTATION=+